MNDDLIRSYMTAAGMLMEDVSAKVVSTHWRRSASASWVASL
ncbi:hypothetical protein [Sphingomonas citri]|nr:hypothetical protein [Sphingomonas citri]